MGPFSCLAGLKMIYTGNRCLKMPALNTESKISWILGPDQIAQQMCRIDVKIKQYNQRLCIPITGEDAFFVLTEEYA